MAGCSAEPVPGMIIFFDWDNKGGSGPQDGEADHVGIVQKVENGIIYTVEGNSGNLCRVNRYSVGQYEIMATVFCARNRKKENGVTPLGGTIFIKSNAANELTITHQTL